MKKFIATAALVAASTALASAATVVFTTVTETTITGATSTVTLVGNPEKDSNNNKAEISSQTFTSSTTFSDASSALSLVYSFGTTTNSDGSTTATKTKTWTSDKSTSTNENTALSGAFTEATGLSLSDYAGQKFYGAGGQNTQAVLTFSGLKANTEYRFSFVGAGRGADATLSITTGTLSDTTRGGGSFYGSMSGTDTTLVSNTVTLADACTTTTTTTLTIDKASSAATIVVTSDASGNVVFTSNGSKPGFLAIAVSDVIPEPSAFGLLAGIGALALAVSRRKRSRR